MNDSTVRKMLVEDARRHRAWMLALRNDPIAGRDEKDRVRVPAPEEPGYAFVPIDMIRDAMFRKASSDVLEWQKLRCRYDFEYWAVRCVTIKHKTKAEDVPFVLNYAQRKVLAVLESDRLAGRPIRMILLKARQWGGSTLVQMYMAWIQSMHRRNWHSLICAHVKDTAAIIRGMYTKLLASYPEKLWDGDDAPVFKPYERSVNVREIIGRGCRVTVGSYENLDAFRGSDYAMAHLSETAFWQQTTSRSPEDCIRSVCGAIALMPYSLIVVESTANGVGNYFHKEWLRCKNGAGDKHPVFVPWYEIDHYTASPPDKEEFIRSLNNYEMALWKMGLDLDRIYWYRLKAREYLSPEMFRAEYPTTDLEAFVNTGNAVFPPEQIEELRRNCSEPMAVGEVHGDFNEQENGCFKLWKRPDKDRNYIITVDIGGRSPKSDWSVILAMALPDGDKPMEVAGQWRGHCDHDILVDKAEAIARWYNNGLLVVESNSLESSELGSVAADPNLFVLNRLAERYPNVYRRETYDCIANQATTRVGFHTNRSTKTMLILELIRAVRDGIFVEHDHLACNELQTYEQNNAGAFAAKPGYHDDILMTRALAILLSSSPQATVQRAKMPARSPW